MKSNIIKILDKPMDRKDFLKHIGVGSLFVFGGSMIWQGLQEASKQPAGKTAAGYGASAYGGKRG